MGCRVGEAAPRQNGGAADRFHAHPLESYQQRVPSSVAPVSCQALGSNIKTSAGLQFFMSEAMVDLYSNPTGPGSPELSQRWVQGELEQGQHLSANTQGQGRRRPEETKAEWPNSGRE